MRRSCSIDRLSFDGLITRKPGYQRGLLWPGIGHTAIVEAIAIE